MKPQGRADLVTHLTGLGLTADQVTFIAGIFESEAARLPRSTPFSSSGMYPSFKNRSAILRESRTGELPYYRLLEHDPDVIAYAHQPDCPIHVSWTMKDGGKRNAVRNEDVLVVRRHQVAIVAIKTEAVLAELANERVDDYVRDPETGKWRCPSAEAYLAPFGIEFEVVTPAELPKTFVRNLEALGAAFRAPLPDPATLMAVVKRVRIEPGVPLADVVGENLTLGEAQVLIAAGIVYGNLERDDLSHPRAFPLYPSRAVAEALATRHTPSFAIGGVRPAPLSLASGSRFGWVGATLEVIAAGPVEVILRDVAAGPHATTTALRATLEAAWHDGSLIPQSGVEPKAGPHSGVLLARTRYEATGQEGLEAAQHRRELLTAWTSTGQVPAGTSRRSLRRWEKDRRAMEALTGDPFVGLCPDPRSGNKSARLDGRTSAIIDATIGEVFLVPNGTTVANVVAEVARRCREAKVPEAHRRTVERRIAEIPTDDVVLAREGRKAAYRHRQFAPLDPDAAAPNGDFAWAVAHIDGTQLDLETAHRETGLPLGRPWLHRMVDGAHGRGARPLRRLRRAIRGGRPRAPLALRLALGSAAAQDRRRPRVRAPRARAHDLLPGLRGRDRLAPEVAASPRRPRGARIPDARPRPALLDRGEHPDASQRAPADQGGRPDARGDPRPRLARRRARGVQRDRRAADRPAPGPDPARRARRRPRRARRIDDPLRGARRAAPVPHHGPGRGGHAHAPPRPGVHRRPPRLPPRVVQGPPAGRHEATRPQGARRSLVRPRRCRRALRPGGVPVARPGPGHLGGRDQSRRRRADPDRHGRRTREPRGEDRARRAARADPRDGRPTPGAPARRDERSHPGCPSGGRHRPDGHACAPSVPVVDAPPDDDPWAYAWEGTRMTARHNALRFAIPPSLGAPSHEGEDR